MNIDRIVSETQPHDTVDGQINPVSPSDDVVPLSPNSDHFPLTKAEKKALKNRRHRHNKQQRKRLALLNSNATNDQNRKRSIGMINSAPSGFINCPRCSAVIPEDTYHELHIKHIMACYNTTGTTVTIDGKQVRTMKSSKQSYSSTGKPKCPVLVSDVDEEPCGKTLNSQFAVAIIVKPVDKEREEFRKVCCSYTHFNVGQWNQDVIVDVGSMVSEYIKQKQPRKNKKCFGCGRNCSETLRVESNKIKPENYDIDRAMFFCTANCLVKRLNKFTKRCWESEVKYQHGKIKEREKPKKACMDDDIKSKKKSNKSKPSEVVEDD